MDLNSIIRMVVNTLLRRFMGRAINSGIDYASRRGRDASEMTPAEREQARSAKDLAQRARKLSRITRRF
jgi:hypothetical protein